jgi:hypothetical protein
MFDLTNAATGGLRNGSAMQWLQSVLTNLMIPRLYITDALGKQPQSGLCAAILRRAMAVVNLKFADGWTVGGRQDV